MRSLKKFILAAALVTVNAAAFANSEDRHLSGFNSVQVSGSFDVYITQGSSESVKVDAPADVIDKIITEVDGNTLKIYNKRENFSFNGTKTKRMIVYVTIKDVNAIGLSGSGDVFFKDGIRANTLKLQLTGSGDVTGKLDVKTLETSLRGSGDITISGRADNSSVSVVGSGDYSAGDLVTMSTAVSVRGSGDARVNASEKLEASVAGSGDIHYRGSVKSVSSSKSGSGDISRM